MGRFIKGDILAVPFPFSDLQAGKVRPALLVASPVGDEAILCMITSTYRDDGYSIPIVNADFASGRLSHNSYARACHLFTFDVSTINETGRRGTLKPPKLAEIVDKIIQMLKN